VSGAVSYCCRKVPCVAAVRIHGPVERCPELNYHDGRWWCGLIERAKGALRDRYVEDMAIGAGCCSSLFNQDRETIPTPDECGWDEKPDPINWKRAFQQLCSGLGHTRMDGDKIDLLARWLEQQMGSKVAIEFYHWVVRRK